MASGSGTTFTQLRDEIMKPLARGSVRLLDRESPLFRALRPLGKFANPSYDASWMSLRGTVLVPTRQERDDILSSDSLDIWTVSRLIHESRHIGLWREGVLHYLRYAWPHAILGLIVPMAVSLTILVATSWAPVSFVATMIAWAVVGIAVILLPAARPTYRIECELDAYMYQMTALWAFGRRRTAEAVGHYAAAALTNGTYLWNDSHDRRVLTARMKAWTAHLYRRAHSDEPLPDGHELVWQWIRTRIRP